MTQTIPLINHTSRVNIRCAIAGRRNMLLQDWLRTWEGTRNPDILQYWANELSELNKADEQLEAWFMVSRTSPQVA